MDNFWTFLQQTAACSLTAAFLLILQRMFRDKLSPKWQYAVWLVLLVRLLVPAGWSVGSPLDVTVWFTCLQLLAELPLSSAWSSPWQLLTPRAGVPLLPAGGAPRSLTDWLFLLYLAGAVVCAAWLLLGWARLRGAVRRGRPLSEERLARIRDHAAALGLKAPARAVECPVPGPFLMGVLRPVLVVPQGWEFDGQVVLHELIHLKNRDVAAGWLTALFRCVHWCNPFLWKVFDRIDNQREQRCDQQVLERLRGEERRDYGRTLLSMAEDGVLRVPGATSMANGGAHIKARIEAIARFKTFPKGMGLVTGCMTVVLILQLACPFPVSAQAPVPAFVTQLGAGGQLAYAVTHRPTTPAGALDAFSKGIYKGADDPNGAFTCLAAVTPWEELPALVEKLERTWAEFESNPFSRIDACEAAYRTGPIFRGLYDDGDGGYWTQMYFFRDGESRSNILWQRRTLSLRPQPDGTWTAEELSSAQGALPEDWRENYYGDTTLPIPEKPIYTWTAQADGVEIELWPDSNLRVQDAYINGSSVTDLALNEFGRSVRTERPDPDAQFVSCTGAMAGRLTNTTDEVKRFTLVARQFAGEDGTVFHSDDGFGSPFFSDPFFSHSSSALLGGYDIGGLELELRPGQSIPLYYGGQGHGRGRAGLPLEQCVSASVLEGQYQNRDTGEIFWLDLQREVNLQ